MPNYQEGKIYKIYNTINDDIYVGSTTRKLCERMAEHRGRINHKDNHNPLYQSFIEHGVEHFYIELIEKCPCNCKDELRKKEGEYIRLLKPSMNKRIEGRTASEYTKEWLINNKEKIKEYYENNKEKLKDKSKEYYENNKDKINERNKKWKENNKEYLKSYSGEKITCECGCVVTRHYLTQHKRNAKHKQLMNE